MDKVMMECGHEANGTCEGKPCCVICYDGPDSPGGKIAKVVPDLTGRMARCGYYGGPINKPGSYHGCECPECKKRYREDCVVCLCEKPSSDKLAFFRYHPDKKFDEFYCGCCSWE